MVKVDSEIESATPRLLVTSGPYVTDRPSDGQTPCRVAHSSTESVSQSVSQSLKATDADVDISRPFRAARCGNRGRPFFFFAVIVAAAALRFGDHGAEEHVGVGGAARASVGRRRCLRSSR